MLRVRLAARTPRAAYACGVLLDVLGVQWCEVGEGSEADVGYGRGTGARLGIPSIAPDAWDDPRPSLSVDDGLPIVHPAGTAPQRRVDGGLGFDVLYATYACLTAPWERADPGNEVGTPLASDGWLAAHGLLERPLVHEYAAALGDALGIEPARREPVLVVTHDVDEQFGHLFGIRESWTRVRRDLRRGSPAALRRAG